MSRAAISAVPLVVDEITLDGKRVQVQSVDLPLDQVTLDPRNPRIANTVSISISEEGAALQRRLEALLWEDGDVRDLYRQVLINKGLVERIIVRQDGKVVEGNCRTVVYRKLREKQPNERRWKNIPARLLPPDIGDRDVAILLGEMHVAGKLFHEGDWISLDGTTGRVIEGKVPLLAATPDDPILGITHLAAAAGAPVLAIFGPTDPAIWAPRGPHVRVARWKS